MSNLTQQNSLKTTQSSKLDENVTLMLLLAYNKMKLFADSLKNSESANQSQN